MNLTKTEPEEQEIDRQNTEPIEREGIPVWPGVRILVARTALRRLKRVFPCCSVCETMEYYEEGHLMVWTNYMSPCNSIVGLYFWGLLTSCQLLRQRTKWNSRPGAGTGVNSRRDDSRRHDILCWYHVNKCRAMNGNRSELAPTGKSPRCHVNTIL